MDLKEENKILKMQINEILEELKIIIKKQNDENKNLKEEIGIIKKKYEELKEKNNNEKLKDIKEEEYNKMNINSVIMKNGEFDMVKNAIESRMNKNVKEVKKLYQATIDGGEVTNFHSKCDNIPNTLTIIQSKGNRRFGGFT